jgi:hypothetical protein
LVVKILNCRPLSSVEAAELLELVPVGMTKGEREQPLIVRFHCDRCRATFTVVWLFPDTPLPHDYRDHSHTVSPQDLAKFRKEHPNCLSE